MPSLSKLLSLSALGANLAQTKLVQRFIRELSQLVITSIATGLLTGAFLIGVFFLLYEGLTLYGLEPVAAQLVTAVLALITLTFLTVKLSKQLRQLKYIPRQIAGGNSPLATKVNQLADSFLDGLLESPAHK